MKKYIGPGCITTEFLDGDQLEIALNDVVNCPVSPFTLAFFRYFVNREISNNNRGFQYAIKEAVSRL